MFKKIVFIFLVITLAACVRSRIMPQPGINYEPTDPASIEIYYLNPEKAFIKIGVVEASGAPASKWKKVENYLKKEASKIGGQAIIIADTDRPVRFVNSQGLLFRKKNLTGIVIRWK